LPHRREVLLEDQPIRLGGRAFDVLIALIEARAAVVSKDALMARVWPGRDDVETGLPLLRAGLSEKAEAKFSIFRLIASQMAETLGRAGHSGMHLPPGRRRSSHSIRSQRGKLAHCRAPRVKGELLLLQGGTGSPAAAEHHFRQALEWAGRQGALCANRFGGARFRAGAGRPCWRPTENSSPKSSC
jgi:hypothetical protein